MIDKRLFWEESKRAGFWINPFGSLLTFEMLIPPRPVVIGLEGILRKVKLLFPPICALVWNTKRVKKNTEKQYKLNFTGDIQKISTNIINTYHFVRWKINLAKFAEILTLTTDYLVPKLFEFINKVLF